MKLYFAIKVVAAFTLLSRMAACQGMDQKTILPLPKEPFMVEYQEEPYSVARHWIKVNNENNKSSISVFLHVPVLAGSTEKQLVFPTREWQQKYAEAIKGKVGDNIPGYLLESSFKAAPHGILPDTVQFPLLIFGPGLGWLPTDYYRLILPLVSKGIAVATVGATPASPVVQFPDGEFDKAERTAVDYHGCAKNLELVADELIRMNSDPSGKYYQRFDTHNIIVGGHSISGAAAYLAAANNTRIRAMINLDGDVNDELSRIKIKQPVLYITSQPQGVKDSTVTAWADNKSEKRRDTYFRENTSIAKSAIRIKVPNMGHSDFLDVAALKDHIEPRYLRNRFGSIDPTLSTTLVIDAMAVFILGQSKGGDWKLYQEKYPHLYVDGTF